MIPPLGKAGRRIMDIWERLTKLKDIIDAGTILDLYGATLEDLDLLAKVGELMGRIKSAR